MDLFKRKNTRECTKLDHCDTNIYKSKERSKDSKMLRRLSRRRLSHEIKAEISEQC